MSPAEEKGEISTEFFKRLNQQIVQKDNLIKLLQLQIKNLKAQVEEGDSTEGPKKAELQKKLEEKEKEIERLQSELETQKARLAALEREKDEQIQALNQIIEQSKGNLSNESSKIQELESTIARLEQELKTEKDARIAAEQAISEHEKASKTYLDNQNKLEAELKRLTDELTKRQEANTALEKQISNLQAQLEQSNRELQEKMAQLAEANASNNLNETTELANRIAELEQDNQILKNLLAEKDEQLSKSENAGASIEALTAELEMTKKRAERVEELEKLVANLEAELATVPELRAKISHLENESTAMAEAAMKMTALESEREQLANQLKERDNKVASLSEQLKERDKQIATLSEQLKERDDKLNTLATQISELNQNLAQKEQELASLRVAAETKITADDLSTRKEIEQLTTQVADQLLAIQRFEELIKKYQEQITAKDEEIAILKNKLNEIKSGSGVITIQSESEIISSFIDFFDGLDNFLSKNPIPELQNLHRKLLDRLILPNQISYMPVISETYDEALHIATDYFRSTKFPEKCIVFEVEKGYRKGDLILKKSKVWVVQNLYHCTNCQTLQSNPESRFCHMCGAKIKAPNGLPVESLPWFEPTPTTYLKFAERMLEKNRLDDAINYLKEGLALDPDYVPLLVKLADVHAIKSEFTQAIQVLQKAVALKPDPRISEQIKALEVKNTIFQQAQALNLSSEEFEKLVNLIQTKNQLS